jgi:hypothetical protein
LYFSINLCLQDVLRPLVNVALKLSNLPALIHRESPTVIT